MNPNGQLPAYEWDFGDVNPPVHAFAALRVFLIDGGTDHTGWSGSSTSCCSASRGGPTSRTRPAINLFGGGFLGMDNVGPFDRSAPQPAGAGARAGRRHRLDGALLPEHARDLAVLAEHDHAYEDVAIKFFEHYAMIVAAINDRGLWDESDGFYYDQVRRASDGTAYPVRVRSMTGLLPLCAVASVRPSADRSRSGSSPAEVRRFLSCTPEYAGGVCSRRPETAGLATLALVDPDRLPRVLQRLADEGEFLSPHGMRVAVGRIPR